MFGSWNGTVWTVEPFDPASHLNLNVLSGLVYETMHYKHADVRWTHSKPNKLLMCNPIRPQLSKKREKREKRRNPFGIGRHPKSSQPNPACVVSSELVTSAYLFGRIWLINRKFNVRKKYYSLTRNKINKPNWMKHRLTLVASLVQTRRAVHCALRTSTARAWPLATSRIEGCDVT